MNENNTLLCLDLGNTTCRGGIWSDNKIQQERSIKTRDFLIAPKEWLDGWGHKRKIVYCSVVPNAEDTLKLILASQNFDKPFSLNATTQSLLPITYPSPDEIGTDRIANSYSVYKSYPLPAIVIDLGTATTFDVISEKGGYLGGVIVPGPQGMLDYLSDRTALLPQFSLNHQEPAKTAIGKSTKLAMMSGIQHGYVPMLEGVIRSISIELENNGESIASVIQTGGEAKNFPMDRAILAPSLTLEGLALAYFDQQSENKENEC